MTKRRGFPVSLRSMASALAVEGYSLNSGELPPVPNWSSVDSGYLGAMKIPLRTGRSS